jgi:hypothetical protein
MTGLDCWCRPSAWLPAAAALGGIAAGLWYHYRLRPRLA